MNDVNTIGEIGEKIFNLKITKSYKFLPVQLGEKYPNVDFFVELIGHSHPYYFLVQVKATKLGLNKNKKLKISIPKSKINSLAIYSCPTYLIGVDTNTDFAYIYPVNKIPRKGLSSFPTNKLLDMKTLDNLYNDVIIFWDNIKIQKSKHKHRL
jgi:hypothetical protein